jgi:hypothetical protein
VSRPGTHSHQVQEKTIKTTTVWLVLVHASYPLHGLCHRIISYVPSINNMVFFCAVVWFPPQQTTSFFFRHKLAPPCDLHLIIKQGCIYAKVYTTILCMRLHLKFRIFYIVTFECNIAWFVTLYAKCQRFYLQTCV